MILSKKLARIICLCLGLCLVIASGAFAKNDTTLYPKVEKSSYIKKVQGASEAVNPGIQAKSPDNNYLLLDESEVATYDYQLKYNKKDVRHVDVTLNMALKEKGGKITLNTKGTVARFTLNDGRVLIRGPLYGNYSRNGNKYDYSVGYTQIEGNDDISLGLTITSLDDKYQVCYTMGTPVMTKELYDSINSTIEDTQSYSESNSISPTQSNIATTIATSNYAYYSGVMGSCIPVSGWSNVTDIGNYTKVFKNDYDKRFMLTLESNSTIFDQSDFTPMVFYEAYISAFQFGLRRTSTSGYIAGMEEITLPYTSGDSIALSTAFSRASSLLSYLPSPYGVGASIISVLLTNMDADTTYQSTNFTDYNYIHCDLPFYDKLRLDNAPLPVVFQIADASAYNVNFTATAFTDLTYQIVLFEGDLFIRTTRAQTSVSMAV